MTDRSFCCGDVAAGARLCASRSCRWSFWRLGAVANAVPDQALQLVQDCPEVAPHEVDALGVALPDTLAGLDPPRPRAIRQTRRSAARRFARLTPGRETGLDGPRS